MSLGHRLEALLVATLVALVRALPVGAALGLGAGLGDLARRLGVRRQVARANLAMAFPDRPAAERERILAAHYRDLGMMLCEAARGGATVYAPEGKVVAAVRGLEHLEAARRAGRGAIILTGHYGDYGLIAGWLGRLNPMEILVQGLGNPWVDDLMRRTCLEGGVQCRTGMSGLRQLIVGLRNNGWAVLLGDQDAGRGGIFVPFLGRPASTSPLAAGLALRTGAPIVMAFITRRADGRNEIDIMPPLAPEGLDGGHDGAVDAEEPIAALTARHTALLERWVRQHPHMWFWLHKRWKTLPPTAAREGDTQRTEAGLPGPGTSAARVANGA